MSSPHKPRRRPPWWPQDEPWPPDHGRGPWARGGSGRDGEWRARRRPFGCFVVVFLFFGAATLTAGVWALAALLGLVSAPPVVLVGGLVVTALVAAGAFAAFRIVRGTSVAIDELSAAAERIERGDYSARVSVDGPPQVRTLAHAFNQMSSRLADIDAGRRTFLADVAHELRTPLTVIKAQIEAIGDGLYPADDAHMAPIHDQIAALEKLISDMHTVALAEAGALTLNLQPVDVGQLVVDVALAFDRQADAVGVRIEVDPSTQLPKASGDEARLRQVLANLLSNAIRHAPPGSAVAVGVFAGEPGRISVSVTDSGSGIAPDLLPRVFDRFVKDAESGGSGLGLAIARDLIEAHGGTISITSRPGSGTTVTFSLPLA